ncbi:MAG: biopolymer transporter ExbD [Lentisphaeria bacterium]|nr:biopolymer transporter ExbD [Lentisphaeria bacterium]NQZ66507.1 biopolymer transporter ExbD [Lentisphaeria bacterium]
MRLLGKRRKKKRKTDLDLTPLMDVIFILLIFFMITSTFHEETRVLDLTLPRAKNPKIVKMDKFLTINVTKENLIYIDTDEEPVDPAKLQEILKQRIEESEVKNVLINGDEDAKYKTITAIIDALNALEIDGISFAVIYS